MSRIYTRTGDSGTTQLIGGERVGKSSQRLMAYGTIDELNSYMGLLVSFLEVKVETEENLRWIQRILFSVGGALATDTTHTKLHESCVILPSHVERLEGMIDALTQQLPPQRSFILPGGSRAASIAHVARCVCRRAEREIVLLSKECHVPSELLKLINRLSDYLYVMARLINFLSGIEENSL